MTLRAALVIGLRLYAISLAVQALDLVPSIVFEIASAFHYGSNWMGGLAIVELVVLGLLATFVWRITIRLAGAIAKGVDGNITFHITAEEACAVSFVFLGLYFALGAISPVIVNSYNLLTFDGPHLNGDRYQGELISRLCTFAIEFIFGMGCVLGSKSFARKLTRGKMWPPESQ
jgi:hypothetical protein